MAARAADEAKDDDRGSSTLRDDFDRLREDVAGLKRTLASLGSRGAAEARAAADAKLDELHDELERLAGDLHLRGEDALFGIEQAMTRATRDGDVCGPDERVDLDTAIRMHTINGAYAEFAEHWKGSIEVGKHADLVVLSDDIRRVPATQLRDLPIALTMVGGQVAYEA